jgi:hypothetical protein
MKLLAQHGHQPSDIIARGVQEGIIEGAVLSPRYLGPEKIAGKISEIRAANSGATILLDPEYYATRQIGTPNNQLGHLEDWSYFTSQSRRDLVRGQAVETALCRVCEATAGLDVSAHIAPNVYVAQSFDSMEAGIALNFVAGAKAVFRNTSKPVYATLAIDRRALIHSPDFMSFFKSFLNDLTALEEPPDGFYILVGGGLIDERSDLVHSEVVNADVVGGWMMLNYTLAQNGFKVINGCADLLAPFLCAVGGSAGATGWWSNLRLFTMGRYIKPEGRGGQPPIVRYVSKRLMNRIKFDELRAYERILPGVLNDLPHDVDYTARIPDRTAEALQTWEAVSSLNQKLTGGDVETNLRNLAAHVENAKATYASVQTRGISEGIETVTEYLDQLSGAIDTFRRLAEL